ncbi:hypothetical protein [Promicromonospora soli]
MPVTTQMSEPVRHSCAGATMCARNANKRTPPAHGAEGVRLAGDVSNAASVLNDRRLTCSEAQECADLRQGDAKGVEQGGDDVNDGHGAIPSGKRESQDDHL